MIKLEKYEYRRCFNRFLDGFAMFDWHEMYPITFGVTPINVRISQRIESFRTGCLYEIEHKLKTILYAKKDWFLTEEFDEYFLLSCYYENELYKHIKLLKNNKVDFTYDKAIYATGEDDYIENLFERHMEALNALSGHNFAI